MPQLARSDSASAGSGFSWKPWIRPSSPVMTTPNCEVSLTRLVASVAIAPASALASCASRIAVRSTSVSASPEMTRNDSLSARNFRDLADAAGGAQRLGLLAVAELDPRGRAVAEVLADRLGPVGEVGDHLRETVLGEQPRDVLHHRHVQHRRHRLRHQVGQRPQPRAEACRQDHRPHSGSAPMSPGRTVTRRQGYEDNAAREWVKEERRAQEDPDRAADRPRRRRGTDAGGDRRRTEPRPDAAHDRALAARGAAGRRARRRSDGARRGAASRRRSAGCSRRSRTDRPGVLGEAGLGTLQVVAVDLRGPGPRQGKTELAIVFTDLVDFSDWALDAGDTAAVELLRDVSVAIEPPVKSHDGEVVKRLGDGMMAVFKSAERRPRRARRGARAPGRDRGRRLRAADPRRHPRRQAPQGQQGLLRGRRQHRRPGRRGRRPRRAPALRRDPRGDRAPSELKVEGAPPARRQGSPRGLPGLRGQADPGRRLPADQRRALDPAGRDRASRQPLLGPRRPARERDRLADRGGVRRRRLPHPQRPAARPAAASAPATASPPSPRTPAARRATASSPWSAWPRSSPTAAPPEAPPPDPPGPRREGTAPGAEAPTSQRKAERRRRRRRNRERQCDKAPTGRAPSALEALSRFEPYS